MRLTVAGRPGSVELSGVRCPWAHAVAFSGADLGLVAGGPGVRRAYLDGVAAKLVPAHAAACRRYRLVLHQRTGLLSRLAGRREVESLLGPWDDQLADLGSEVVHRRLETLATLEGSVRETWACLGSATRGLELAYRGAIDAGPDRAATRERLRAALVAGRGRDLARGLTSVGPHRDELAVRLEGAEARVFASRGEQRLVALVLRLAEADAVRRRTETPPLLLLDDLFGELDQAVRGRVLAWLARQGQVVYAATEELSPGAGSAIFEVRDGGVGMRERIVARGVA